MGPTGNSDPRLDSYRFGSVAYLRGHVSLWQLQQALAEQVEDNVSGRPHRLLGTILKQKKWITEEEEEEILARLGSVER